MNTNELIKKYNVPGPRYTSYPTVPFWKNQTLKAELVSVKEEAVNLAKQTKIEGINLNNTGVETASKPKSTLEVIRKSIKNN